MGHSLPAPKVCVHSSCVPVLLTDVPHILTTKTPEEAVLEHRAVCQRVSRVIKPVMSLATQGHGRQCGNHTNSARATSISQSISQSDAPCSYHNGAVPRALSLELVYEHRPGHHALQPPLDRPAWSPASLREPPSAEQTPANRKPEGCHTHAVQTQTIHTPTNTPTHPKTSHEWRGTRRGQRTLRTQAGCNTHPGRSTSDLCNKPTVQV